MQKKELQETAFTLQQLIQCRNTTGEDMISEIRDHAGSLRQDEGPVGVHAARMKGKGPEGLSKVFR